jgi:hypothetical protein
MPVGAGHRVCRRALLDVAVPWVGGGMAGWLEWHKGRGRQRESQGRGQLQAGPLDGGGGAAGRVRNGTGLVYARTVLAAGAASCVWLDGVHKGRLPGAGTGPPVRVAGWSR